MKSFCIKSATCIIPGFNSSDGGELISTEELLSNMKDISGDNADKFDSSFIKKKIGIESVSFTKTSINFLKKYWSMKQKPSKYEIFSASQSTPNTHLYEILGKSINSSIKYLKDQEGSLDLESFIAHIHISAFFTPWVEAEFLKIRQDIGIGLKKPIQTLMLQQGCSGLFTALEVAKNILIGNQSKSKEHILITSDNNMMIHAHQRCERIAGTNNVNEWLWPAIFGEAVGSIIVSSEDIKDSGNRWCLSVDSIDQSIVDTNWRVKHQWKSDEKTTSVYIKAKEVSETYLKYIKKFGIDAIEKSGGLDELYRICLHESNPRLISIMKRELNISNYETVPSISSKVGTLACVSSFSLIDIVMRDIIRNMNSYKKDKKSKLAMILIGETCGNIVAGNICLSAKQY